MIGKINRQKLTLRPMQNGYDSARHIPKYDIEHDAKFFDLQSLVRMYGRETVKRYLGGLRK